MKYYIASDHNGVDIEEELVEYYKSKNIILEQVNIEHSPIDDYPDFAEAVSRLVVENNGLGILLCGTGIGMSIAANKIKGILAARCINENDAYLAREHNHANVICLPQSLEFDEYIKIIDTFITTLESQDERHVRRVNKIMSLEK